MRIHEGFSAVSTGCTGPEVSADTNVLVPIRRAPRVYIVEEVRDEKIISHYDAFDKAASMLSLNVRATIGANESRVAELSKKLTSIINPSI